MDIVALIQLTKEALKVDEGFRGKTYMDSTGNLTIGYGWAIQICPIRLAEAELRLSNDVAEVIGQLTQALPWFNDLDLVRQSVLANMCFNLGIYGLLKFERTLRAIQNKEYSIAAIEMLNSTWATQVGVRATRLAEEMKTGVR